MRVQNEAYWDFAQGIRNKLRNEVNGLVKFEIYEEIDTIIFRIFFKDFDFNYGINDVQSIIYDGSSEEVVCDILSRYKKAILNGFFKTEDRKRRDEAIRLGIQKEEYV